MYNRPQKLVAEFTGTFGVVLFSAGAICADRFLRTSGQAALGPLGIAAAYGLAVAALIATLGHVSGGHFNPALTIAFWVTRKVSTFDALIYCVSQLSGALAAGYFLRRLPFEVWSVVQAGTPDLANGITRTEGMILEAVLTFFVVLAAFAGIGNTREVRSPMKMTWLAVGLAVTVAALIGDPFTGAALNPARAFGPAFVANHWSNQGVYWVGPLAGGVLAGWLYTMIFVAKDGSEEK